MTRYHSFATCTWLSSAPLFYHSLIGFWCDSSSSAAQVSYICTRDQDSLLQCSSGTAGRIELVTARQLQFRKQRRAAEQVCNGLTRRLYEPGCGCQLRAAPEETAHQSLQVIQFRDSWTARQYRCTSQSSIRAEWSKDDKITWAAGVWRFSRMSQQDPPLDISVGCAPIVLLTAVSLHGMFIYCMFILPHLEVQSCTVQSGILCLINHQVKKRLLGSVMQLRSHDKKGDLTVCPCGFAVPK